MSGLRLRVVTPACLTTSGRRGRARLMRFCTSEAIHSFERQRMWMPLVSGTLGSPPVGGSRSLGEVAFEAAVFAEDRGTQLQDGLRSRRAVPILLSPLDPCVEVPHQGFHQTARERQPLLAITR